MHRTRFSFFIIGISLLSAIPGISDADQATGTRMPAVQDRPVSPACLRPTPRQRDAQDASDDLLSRQSAYFDDDQYRPQAVARAVIAAHARHLATHPTLHVKVIGHTDARGNREYNLALGLKRAETVRQALLEHGASDEQVTIISYGAECPASPGNRGTAPSGNRRVDIVYDE